MQKILFAFSLLAALLVLSACQTVTPEQCAAGDWEALGRADAAAGHDISRFEKIVKDCGRQGVTPDAALYQKGWNKGVQLYCTPLNGFNLGRQGKSLSNICPPQVASDFQWSHSLGRQIWTAEDRVRRLERDISSKESAVSRLRSDVDDISCSGKQGEDLRECRANRNDKRQELQDARFDLQDMKWRLRDRQREYDEIVRSVSAEAARNIPGFGG
jgi:hypothetical protein